MSRRKGYNNNNNNNNNNNTNMSNIKMDVRKMACEYNIFVEMAQQHF